LTVKLKPPLCDGTLGSIGVAADTALIAVELFAAAGRVLTAVDVARGERLAATEFPAAGVLGDAMRPALELLAALSAGVVSRGVRVGWRVYLPRREVPDTGSVRAIVEVVLGAFEFVMTNPDFGDDCSEGFVFVFLAVTLFVEVVFNAGGVTAGVTIFCGAEAVTGLTVETIGRFICTSGEVLAGILFERARSLCAFCSSLS
jgi:hypothetical protein